MHGTCHRPFVSVNLTPSLDFTFAVQQDEFKHIEDNSMSLCSRTSRLIFHPSLPFQIEENFTMCSPCAEFLKTKSNLFKETVEKLIMPY